MISKDIFRAYDIRGIVGKTLTTEVVELIGRALGTLMQARDEHIILTARDGRNSGISLLAALHRGLLQSGCTVVDIGCVPTPVLYFATHVLNITSGVMLTGSHNPPDYNGLKMVVSGDTLTAVDIEQLYFLIQDKKFKHGSGTLKTYESIVQEYQQYVCANVRLARPLKIVVDCGNGVAGHVAPALYKALGCEVVELYCEVDGAFPNHHPDPSQPDNLRDLISAVKTQQADIGLAFDGDGDRLGVVTNTGEIIWPDRQLILYAKDVLSRHPGALIIYDVKCTKHLASFIKEYGGRSLMWRTGHSLIKAKMKETGALLAGEMSGHAFFSERWFGFDDGIYTGARLLEILSKEYQSAHEVFAAIPNSVNTPELNMVLTEESKWIFMKEFIQHAHFEEAAISDIDGLRADFCDGFGLVRVSNTTPNLVLRFEADNQQALQRIQHQFRQIFKKVDANCELPF